MVELPKVKRKPGRPKGSTKWPGSGRKKGTVNKSTAELRRYIHRNANPVAQVCKIAKGKVEIEGLSQADAIKLLYKAVIPELKGEVLTGEDGAPLIEPTRRDKLMTTFESAMIISLALRKGEEAKKELAALDAISVDPEPELEMAAAAPEPSVEPIEPSLPKHAYVYIEEGERERSGERAWLAMEGRGKILRTFHGVDARRLARDWIGTKFGASPAKEVEIPLPEREAV